MRVPMIQIYITPARPTAPVRPDAPTRPTVDTSVAIEVRTCGAARCLFPAQPPAPVDCRRTLFPTIPGEEDESEEMELERPMSPPEMACRRFFANLCPTELVGDRIFTLHGAFVDFMSARGGQGRHAYHVESREQDTTVMGCLLLENDRPGEIVVRDVALLPLRIDNLPLLLDQISLVLRGTKACFQGVKNIYVEVPQQSKFLIPSGAHDCTDMDMKHAIRLFHNHGFQGVPRGACEGIDLQGYHWRRYPELAGFQLSRSSSP